MENLLTIKDLAAMLKVSEPTAAKLALQMNPLDVSVDHGCGKRQNIRVPAENFQRWLTTRTQQPVDNVPPVHKSRKKAPEADAYCDQYGRLLRRKNGRMVAMATAPQ